MTTSPDASDPYLQLTDRAAHEAAVRSRAERRRRQALAAGTATWLGTLRDLAERRAIVVLQVRGGRPLRGLLVALSSDHLVLVTASGGRVHLRLSAVRTARPEPGRGAPPASGDREAPSTATIEDVLDALAEEGGSAALLLGDVVDPVRGRIEAIGEDVVSLRLEGPDPALVYAPVGAVDGVMVE
ncbi:hypothetical protein [Egicoccus sp. AB-alg2]|uniref:hypothetical protein n=1 Tax=Egicoccus sp. AB-alg2 TaxID=3242693 RepID=UPI00359D2386